MQKREIGEFRYVGVQARAFKLCGTSQSRNSGQQLNDLRDLPSFQNDQTTAFPLELGS